MIGSNTDTLLESYRDFWDSTASVYSNAKLTNEGGEDLEVILSRSGSIDNMVCLGVATGCRDPLFLLDKGIKPKKLLVNDLSPNLLRICLASLSSYSELDMLSLVGPIHRTLEKSAEGIEGFFGKSEPLLAVGVYKKDAFYTKFNGYSALELYSEERTNIGDNCVVYPIFYEGEILNTKSKGIDFKLPLSSRQIGRIAKFLQKYESSRGFGGFQFNSVKNGNPFISHYYTKELLEKIFVDTFPGYQISIVDTQTRNYVVFVGGKDSNQNTLITMINNVLGNIPLNLQKETLRSIRDRFYR